MQAALLTCYLGFPRHTETALPLRPSSLTTLSAFLPYRDRAPPARTQSHTSFGISAPQSTFHVLPRRQPAISTKGAPRDFYTSTQDKGCDHRAFYVPERSFLQVLLHHDHSERVCCNRHYIAPISKRVRTRFAHHAPRQTFRVEIFCCTQVDYIHDRPRQRQIRLFTLLFT